ncbi:MAG: hypothetical protein DSZ27_00935 [Thiomicrospira sp.]|nr:MAG: hypothetical protein DSZ27_00935 [Thiomicrospira sp.]
MSEMNRKVPELRFIGFNDFWRATPFGDIYSFSATNSLSRASLNDSTGEYKNIHYGDIHTKYSTMLDAKNASIPYVTDFNELSNSHAKSHCEVGDLVFADASEDYADVGKAIQIISLPAEPLVSGLHTFLAKDNYHQTALGFSGYLMSSYKVRKQIMTMAVGAKVLGISKTNLAKVLLDIPTKEEQQKIANFLSSVDKKIEQLTEKHRLLTEYKKGVMQQIFTQQIRFKDNQGYDYPKWHQTKFSNLFKFIKTNSLSRADLVNDGEVMNIHYGDIHTRLPSQTRIETAALPYIAPHIDLSKFEDDTFCRDGDLIVADASEDYLDIGKAIELSAIENNKVIAGLHTFLARPYKSKVVNGFSGYVMQIDPVRKQIMRLATGVSVLGISKTNLGKVILPIPCIDEQQKIANFLTEIDQKIDQAWSILEQTKAFKKGLLQKMFV